MHGKPSPHALNAGRRGRFRAVGVRRLLRGKSAAGCGCCQLRVTHWVASLSAGATFVRVCGANGGQTRCSALAGGGEIGSGEVAVEGPAIPGWLATMSPSAKGPCNAGGTCRTTAAPRSMLVTLQINKLPRAGKLTRPLLTRRCPRDITGRHATVSATCIPQSAFGTGALSPRCGSGTPITEKAP